MTFDPVLYEALTLWPAFADLVERFGDGEKQARDLTEHELVAFAKTLKPQIARAAHFLVGQAITDDLAEAYGIVDELILIMEFGRRPHFGTELGLTPLDFGIGA